MRDAVWSGVAAFLVVIFLASFFCCCSPILTPHKQAANGPSFVLAVHPDHTVTHYPCSFDLVDYHEAVKLCRRRNATLVGDGFFFANRKIIGRNCPTTVWVDAVKPVLSGDRIILPSVLEVEGNGGDSKRPQFAFAREKHGVICQAKKPEVMTAAALHGEAIKTSTSTSTKVTATPKTTPSTTLTTMRASTTTPCTTTSTTRTTTTTEPKTTAKRMGIYCESGWSFFNGYCFKLINKHGCNEAENWCAFEGGVLASIHSAEQNRFLISMIKRTTDYWPVCFGLRRNGRGRNDFFYLDGSDIDYTSWGTLDPNNAKGNELCVEFDDGTGRWIDEPCSAATGGGICQKPATTVPQPPPTLPPSTTSTTTRTTTITTKPRTTTKRMGTHCESGWSFFNGFCFKVIQQRGCNQAQTRCRSAGGELASIHSAEQNRFLIDLIKRTTNDWPVCFGLQRNGYGHDDFYYLDGSKIDYTSWGSLDPNNAKGNEWCVEFDDGTGRWIDEPCYAATGGGICQKPATTSPPPPSTLPPFSFFF